MDQLNIPIPLPKVGKPVTITTAGRYRVYLNYSTLSYSAAWWDWERWQREIDFMAMQGDLRSLAANPFATIGREYPNSAGMGLFMEGIIQNPVYYELAFDSIWRDVPVEPVAWLHDYARRRYGADSESACKAWEILLETAYRPGTDGTENSSIVCARPAIKVTKFGPNGGFKIPYDPKKLLEAWRLLLADGDKLKTSISL